MPVDISELPLEVQLAFLLLSELSDRWDGSTGLYLGKDWSIVEYLFKMHEIDSPKEVFGFMKLIESLQMQVSSEKAEKERKKIEAKSSKSKGHTYKVGG